MIHKITFRSSTLERSKSDLYVTKTLFSECIERDIAICRAMFSGEWKSQPQKFIKNVLFIHFLFYFLDVIKKSGSLEFSWLNKFPPVIRHDCSEKVPADMPDSVS